MRLEGFDYNSSGSYFLTLCTQERKCILSEILSSSVRTGIQKSNTILSKFISTFKRFCNKEYGENIWQARSYDHIIRSYEDYEVHSRYIYDNPMKRESDELNK